eukprot:TRINITY_DN9495_c0_g1_i1.p1 TRINITY_DN9495_c0_g1~~TRINITY_DN9495_c0_g1_i1.p1  ORF type:complete len:2089 (+),score=822.89 TRINITY_DN9495_c0_g1_i1:455-6268(+)
MGIVNSCVTVPGSYLLATEKGVARLVLGEEDHEEENVDEDDYLELDDCTKMVVSRSDPTTVFCLDKAGKLHTVCPTTLVRFFTWAPDSKEVMEDFVLLEDEGSSEVKLLVLTKDKMKEESYFQILEFPSFTTTYRLAVSWFSKLVVAPLNQDTPMVLEGASEDVLKPDTVTRMRIRGISEGVPEARLARLLKRNKFEEAEKFATSFALDKEQIYRAKSAWLLDHLSPWRQEDMARPHKELLEELKTTLGHMLDLDYVVELCVTAALPSLPMTRELLLFARTKIENNVDTISEALMLRVGNTLHRLETFSLVQGEGEASSLVDQWMEFTRACMLNMVEQALTQGDLSKALLLWIRHQAEFKELLDTDQISSLLECIPDSQPCDSVLHWLRQFIPDSLHIVPGCLPVMATWATEAVRRLELGKRKLWPLCGLEFAQAILETMTFNRETGETAVSDFNQFMTLLTLNQQRAEPESPLSHLINLINSLKDLLVLHKQFRIKVKLAEFLDPVKFNVISLILDWVTSPSEVAPLMDNFLSKFILRCDLEINKTLAEYITNLLDNTNFTWHWHIGAAPWEEKVASLLQYITSVEDKSDVILEAVKNAPVPWSETITSICEIGSTLQHRNSVLIKEQASLVSVKTILRKYDCKSYTSNGREAERLLQFLMKKGGDEGYQDALEVCKVIGGKSEQEMQELYLEHLVRDIQDSRSAVKMIQKIVATSSERGIQLCGYMVDTAKLVLKLELGQDLEQGYMEVVKGILGLLSTAKDLMTEQVVEIVGKAETIQRAFCLKTEFGLKTRETDMAGVAQSISSVVANRALLCGYIEKEITGLGTDTEEQLRAMYNRLKRLCDLTKLEHEEAVGRLVLQLAKADLYQPALQVANMLRNTAVTQDLAESIFSVIYRLEGELARGEDKEVEQLVVVLDRMARQTLAYCSDSSLVDCLELFSWQNLSSRVQQESHNRKTFSASMSGQGNTDVYQEWRFTQLYKDKGLPLDKSTVLPLANRCMASVLPLVEDPPLPYLPRHQAAVVEIQDLNVTAPDLETIGNGVDALATCNTLASSGQQLVSQLQLAGHVMLGFSALQVTSAPMSSLLLGTEPEFQEEIGQALSGARSQLVGQLVQRILSEGKCDLALGLGFITAESKRNSLALLAKINSSFGLDYRKISALALVGVEYCGLHGLVKQQEQFKDLYVRACWGKRTAELEINFKNAFNGSKTERINVLKEMVSHPHVDIPMLLQFSKAFQINSNDALTLYSEGLLSKLEPVADQRGKMVVEQFKAVTEKVDQALELITDDDMLYQHLTKMFSSVSPYNYTVLEYILLKIYQTKTYRDEQPPHLQKADKVLGFLLQYERVSEPQPELEVDQWIKERGCPFPALATTRLPLFSLVTLSPKEKYKLLEREFNLDTYRAWIQVSKVLGLAIDNICYFAVKNTVSAMLEKNAKDGLVPSLGSGAWILGHINKSVLENIQICISTMTNSEKATAASHWVVNRLPKGADKVLASVGAETTVEGWCGKDEGNKEALGGLELSRKTRKQLETEQVLHKHGLAQPQYLEMVHQNKPLELVFRLYEDPSIEERNRVAAGQYPDIGAAADSVANINGLNIVKIKYELLDKWLPLANSCSSANDSMSDFTLDLGNVSASGESSSDESNLLRCVYLLQGGGGDGGLQYLLKYAFSTDSMVSTSHKLRALKCLFSICKEEELEKATGKPVLMAQQHMRSLVYLARLEALNLPYSQQSLESCSKVSLVEGIWRTYKHSPEGITLVRDLCIEYQIWSTQLWTAVLDQLCSHSMLKELTTTLTALNSQPHLWNSPQFLSAWNLVLLSPFTSLVPPVTQEKAEKCKQALKLLHFCPTAGDLDLTTLAQECVRVGMFELAAMLLPYLATNTSTVNMVKKEVEGNIQMGDLSKKLRKLEQDGFPSLANIDLMLKTEMKVEPCEASPAL